MDDSDFNRKLIFRSHNLALGYFYEVRGHNLHIFRNRADSLGAPVFTSSVNIFSAFHSSEEKYLVVNHGSGAYGHVPVVFKNTKSIPQLHLCESEYREILKKALKARYKDYAAEEIEVLHLNAPIREIVDGKAIVYASGEFYLPRSNGGFGQKEFDSTYLSLDLESKDVLFLNSDSALRSWYRGHPPLDASYGSGFFVNQRVLLTNSHVVKDAEWVTIGVGNREARGKVVATSKQYDLAVIEIAEKSLKCLPIELAVRVSLGQSARVFGYPLPFHQGYTLKVTQGIVSGLFGLNDNPLHFQMSAPIQPGNSGGAVVDDQGRLIGIAVSSLNKVAVAQQVGSIPENVNFGIHIDVIRRFLEDEQILIETSSGQPAFDPEYSCVQVEVPNFPK